MQGPDPEHKHSGSILILEVVAGLTAAVVVGAIVLLGTSALTARHASDASAAGSGGGRGVATAQSARLGVPHVHCGDIAPPMIGTIVWLEGQRIPAAEGEGGGGGGPPGQSPSASPYSLTYVLISDGSGVCHVSGLEATTQQSDGSDVAVVATVRQAPSGLVYEAMLPKP
jgi:hypothetical protein